MYHPPDFARVFCGNEVVTFDASTPKQKLTFQIELFNLGNLSLPTGKIVAFDPSYSRYEAFEMAVAPGKYPVTLAMAHFDDIYKSVWVASAMIKFEEQEAVTWKIALLPMGDDEKADNFYCYGVDAGLGCFADEIAAAALVRHLDEGDNYMAFINELDKQTRLPNQTCVNLVLEPDNQLNVCVFGSGYGDGCYPSYWGIGADGSIVSLATDFMLGHVDNEDEE